MLVYLTRIEKFNCAHKLWVKSWTPEKNREVFGKCANENFHGHNYTLEVTIKGSPDPMTGFLINASDLSRTINEHVVDHLDHKNLNLDVPFISDETQPTTENLCYIIWKQLESKIEPAKLHRIKLFETDKIYAEYLGE